MPKPRKTTKAKAVVEELSEDEERRRILAMPKPKPPRQVMLIQPMEVPEGRTEASRWRCSSCMRSFYLKEETDAPDTCPKGHPRWGTDGFDAF